MTRVFVCGTCGKRRELDDETTVGRQAKPDVSHYCPKKRDPHTLVKMKEVKSDGA